MKIKDLCSYAPKSRIKAGEAVENAKYLFFTSSADENKRYTDFQFDKEAIIMGTGGNATLHYYNGKFSVSTDCLVLFPNSKIKCKYLYYFFKSHMSVLEAGFKGAGLKHTNKKYIEEINVSKVPDLSTQEKIVSHLDTITENIEKLNRELELFDSLTKARFVEMFCHKGYTVLEWNDVFNTRTGKLDSNAATENGKYPFFTCSKDILYIDDFGFDQEALLLAGNNAAGKYDVKYYKGKFNAYQRTYVLTLRGNWSYQLFRYQLEDKLEYLRQQSLGGLTKYLTMKILGELSFIIPPIEKQKEFELFVQQVDKSRFDIKKSIIELEREVVYD